jgi:signal transduction histidine kinase
MSTPSSALAAVATRRFLASGWPWRSVAYLLTSAPTALAVAAPLGACSLPWVVLIRRLVTHDDRAVGTLVVLAGFATVLAATVGPLWAVGIAALERSRLRLVDDRPAPSGHRRPPTPGPWPWLRTRFTEAATWRELAYAALLATVVPAMYAAVAMVVLLVGLLAASPLLVDTGQPMMLAGLATIVSPRQAVPYAIAGMVLLPTLPYLAALAAGAHAALARALITGDADELLRTELVEVHQSRARLVGAFEAERRRIERDLHDGAQQRLVDLTLRLGLARHDLPPDSAAARTVTDAHEHAKRLMAELRELINGIHPQALTDGGLPAALSDLADRCVLPVTVDVDLPNRPPPHVESTAYFVVAEALTNVVKHAAATRATVTAGEHGGVLTVDVRDDGRGGADPGRGTGLTGLADRVAVLDGRMSMSSPAGGPTVLHVELPCRSQPPAA